LYDLDGELGETYTAANEQYLVLFHRRKACPFQTLVLSFPHIVTMDARVVSTFAFLDFEVPTSAFKLQYSYWDLPELETMVSFWRQHSLASSGATAEMAKAPGLRRGDIELTPLAGFYAALDALMAQDTRIDLAELHYLSKRILDLEAVRQGQEFFDHNGLDVLLSTLNGILNPIQKRCLLANLIALAMEDGLLTSGEQALLDQFGDALSIPPSLARTLFDTMMTKCNLAVLAETPADSSIEGAMPPIVAFTVAMQLMMDADGVIDKDELEFLMRIVPDPEAMQTATAYREAYPVDDLIERTSAALDPRQRPCLMANLVSMALADGQLRPAEQALLERFQTALGIRASEFDTYFEVLQLKNNLTVFTSPP
jgi:uncharacterized tellurite resistance protein B-like protein